MSVELHVEYLPISDLKPYKANARTHSEEQVAQIAASIGEFGFTNPILVGKDFEVIAGHGRLEAAKQRRMDEVPCIRLGHLTANQRRAYVLADNRLAENAGWDYDLLRLELGALASEFDLSLTGFAEDEIASLILDRGGLTDEDEVPNIPENPVSALGDLWKLGSHRLICGDSTDGDCVDRLLGGVVPHLMVTDPPYGVEYDANWRNEAAGIGGFGNPIKAKSGIKTARATGKVLNDDRADWEQAYRLFPGEVCYVWHPSARAHEFGNSLEAAGFSLRMQVIWAKSRFVISRGNYHPQHEPCWYAVRKKSGSTAHWQGSRKESTLWNIDHSKSETGHSTQKPVECMRRPIVNNSSVGQAVYEPFCGSGTTIIAAETEGRACYAIELSPAYVDVSLRRWQEFTGLDAVLDGDGRTFAQIQEDRHG